MALILIADDDEFVVDMVRAALCARGHIVAAVDDGMPVAHIVEFKRPELVILDCNMPELAGIEALRQIRVLRSAYSTPVLILTASRDKCHGVVAIRAGANDYLRKPFDPGQLVSRVETLLMRAALQYRQAPALPMYRPPPPTPRALAQR